MDIAPLTDLVKSRPKLRLVVLHNRQLNAERGKALAGQVYFDISMLEGLNVVSRLIAAVSAERVLFGSHFPLYYFESAVLKVREAGLTQAQTKLIFEQNAQRLLS